MIIDLHDDVEYFQGLLEEMGFTDAEIQYRGFHSQGDGASFTCSYINEKQFLAWLANPTYFKEEVPNTDSKMWAWIKASEGIAGETLGCIMVERGHSNYYHENTVYAKFCGDARGPEMTEALAGLEEDINEVVRDVSVAIYSSLEERYEIECDSYENTCENCRGYTGEHEFNKESLDGCECITDIEKVATVCDWKYEERDNGYLLFKNGTSSFEVTIKETQIEIEGRHPEYDNHTEILEKRNEVFYVNGCPHPVTTLHLYIAFNWIMDFEDELPEALYQIRNEKMAECAERLSFYNFNVNEIMDAM